MMDAIQTNLYNSLNTKLKLTKQDIVNIETTFKCTNATTIQNKYGSVYKNIDKIKPLVISNVEFIYNNDIYSIVEYIEQSKPSYEKDIYEYVVSVCNDSANICRNKMFEYIDNSKYLEYSVDMYIPSRNLAIDCIDTYKDSSINNISKNYLYNKALFFQTQNIRLIYITETEWTYDCDKIKQLLNIALGTSSRIYARECTITLIDNKTARPFNETTHLQNHRNAPITYGLFYKNTLVQLMSFSRTKYNRNLKNDNEWEIIRGCPGSNNIVVGGVSKLFNHFVRDYKPAKVFSYCDFNKFDGRSYEAIGMTCTGYTGPNKWWVIGDKLVPRNPSKYAEYKAISDGTLWGAGSKKYEISF